MTTKNPLPRTFVCEEIEAVELWPSTSTVRARMRLSVGREVRNIVVIAADRPVTFEYTTDGKHWHPARTSAPFAHLLTWIKAT